MLFRALESYRIALTTRKIWKAFRLVLAHRAPLECVCTSHYPDSYQNI